MYDGFFAWDDGQRRKVVDQVPDLRVYVAFCFSFFFCLEEHGSVGCAWEKRGLETIFYLLDGLSEKAGEGSSTCRK